MSLANIFFYTFRTNKFIGEIEEALGREVYVIDRYSKDFEKFLEAVRGSGAEVICGIGISRYYTRFEEVAFNKIGKNEIVKSGPSIVKLNIPKSGNIKTDSKMTFGPCNYVAYRLSLDEGLKNYFLHIRPRDVAKLKTIKF